MKKSKAILMALCAVLLVAASVMGTLAYLTSTDEVVNTFTVGKVAIKLDEAKVDEMGNASSDGARWSPSKEDPEQEYHLLPGHTYTKDPTVYVDKDSEPCYIRAIVTVDSIAQLQSAFPVADYPDFYTSDGSIFLLQKLVGGWSASNWDCVSATAAGVYEFRYVGTGTTNGVYTVPAETTTDYVKLPALFGTVKVPGDIDNDHLAYLDDITITVTAHAIQADGFADAAAAWKAFPTT